MKYAVYRVQRTGGSTQFMSKIYTKYMIEYL